MVVRRFFARSMFALMAVTFAAGQSGVVCAAACLMRMHHGSITGSTHQMHSGQAHESEALPAWCHTPGVPTVSIPVVATMLVSLPATGLEPGLFPAQSFPLVETPSPALQSHAPPIDLPPPRIV